MCRVSHEKVVAQIDHLTATLVRCRVAIDCGARGREALSIENALEDASEAFERLYEMAEAAGLTGADQDDEGVPQLISEPAMLLER